MSFAPGISVFLFQYPFFIYFCYRRNPQHKKDEAHPGDSDYASDTESDDDNDDDDDRPQCEFGVDCYRKNPDHRRDFRHTRVPQPQRRVKRKRPARRKFLLP